MLQFKDFNIKPPPPAFSGDKIKMNKILNKEIIVHKFRIEESKYKEKGNGKRLDIQIELNGNMYICWSSSIVLQDMIQQIPQSSFPFKTTIVMENERYQFT
jgi:hypothetical protein